MRLDKGNQITINIAGIEAVELCESLGHGGFGHVWKARPTTRAKTWFGTRRKKEGVTANTADYYVLKYIKAEDSSQVERIRREASVKIKSRHVIRCLGCAELSAREFALLFPYEPGCNLAEWIAAHPNAAWQDTRQMFLEILDGVRALHQAGIIHRDLKPPNILVTEHYDEPRIIDFGLAKFRGLESMTFSGERFGSPGYAAPEIVFGSNDSKAAGERYDLYALGVILYELIVGEHPRYRMNADGNQSLRGKKHLLETVAFAFDEDPRVAEAIRCSTMFEPEDRLRSVEEMMALLNGQTQQAHVDELVDLTVLDEETPPVGARSPRPVDARHDADRITPAKSAAPQQKPPQVRRVIVPKETPKEVKTEPKIGDSWIEPTTGDSWTEPTTGMILMYIPAGRFMMGQTEAEKTELIKLRGKEKYQEWYANELPRHEVTIQQGFWMGKYPVTQAAWQKIMGNNPSHFKGERRPVENVSWNDAQEFLQKLNATVETHGRASLQFRLPSEAEWEYACRAGTITPFSFGDTINPDQANYDGNYVYGNGKKGVYREQTTDVDSFPPNVWGVCDMHGNVWEWCADTYDASYKNAPSDGNIWGKLDDNKAKVLRGGSWFSQPYDVRGALRYRRVPDDQGGVVGFRVVRVR